MRSKEEEEGRRGGRRGGTVLRLGFGERERCTLGGRRRSERGEHRENLDEQKRGTEGRLGGREGRWDWIVSNNEPKKRKNELR